MGSADHIPEIRESRVGEITKRVKRYQEISIILAILVHFFVFVSGLGLLVLYSLPLTSFILFHVAAQGLAYVNVVFGPRLYKKML
ncbi:MAG: hypothetical protein ACE1ZC_03735, partial [Nitrososphaerales archaeon]